MKQQLKKLVDSLDESETVELLEYVSENLKKFNGKNGKPSIDLSEDPKENFRVFMEAISGVLKKS